MTTRQTCNQCGDQLPDAPRDGRAHPHGYACDTCWQELQTGWPE